MSCLMYLENTSRGWGKVNELVSRNTMKIKGCLLPDKNFNAQVGLCQFCFTALDEPQGTAGSYGSVVIFKT